MENLIQFECNVCFEFKVPYSLACGHNFCLDCANQLKNSRSPCPMCRAKIKKSFEFKTNFLATELYETLKKLNEEQKNKPEQKPETDYENWESIIPNQQIRTNVYKINWSLPTPVQFKTIKKIISGLNLVVESPNGTGKTGSFSLGAVMRVNPDEARLQVICMSHTKEVKDMHFRIISQLSEGVGINIFKTEKIQKPPPLSFQILCGTLDSSINFLRRHYRKLSSVLIIVDECDELFHHDHNTIKFREFISKIPEKQIILYSATLTDNISSLSEEVIPDYEKIVIEPPTQLNPKVKVFSFNFQSDLEKQKFLIECLTRIGFSMCLIFVNTKVLTRVLETLLAQGYKACKFSGDLEDKEREKVLDLVNEGKINVLVSTDVLGRGFDCKYNDLVINFECPRDFENPSKPNFNGFFHRCGRTGRNNRHGTVINLISDRDSHLFTQVYSRFKISLKVSTDISDVVRSIEKNKSDYLNVI